METLIFYLFILSIFLFLLKFPKIVLNKSQLLIAYFMSCRGYRYDITLR